MNGREKTELWIRKWSIVDTSGRPHFPHGIWTIIARLTVYVTFDDNARIGRRVFYFRTDTLQAFADSQAHRAPVLGTMKEARDANTGAGYLLPVTRENVERFEWLESHMTTDESAAAVDIVATRLKTHGYNTDQPFDECRPATIDEQRSGADLILTDRFERYGVASLPIEVKSRRRRQNHDKLFLQLSETNSEGRR